jgi:hypothetical protein
MPGISFFGTVEQYTPLFAPDLMFLLHHDSCIYNTQSPHTVTQKTVSYPPPLTYLLHILYW